MIDPGSGISLAEAGRIAGYAVLGAALGAAAGALLGRQIERNAVRCR